VSTVNTVQSLKVYVIAGEVSGDMLGAKLYDALCKKTDQPIHLMGIGGEELTRCGMQSLFPMRELSIMGIVEIVPHIPNILSRIRQTVEDIKNKRPDVVITIDSPDFCFRVQKKLRGLGIPQIHYTAPSVWAWRPGRAKKIAQFLDHLIAFFPFEPPYFEKEGLPCTFIGHHLVEKSIDSADAEAFKAQHKINEAQKIICVLPGSRRGELEAQLPVYKEALAQLKQQVPNLMLVFPTVQHFQKRITEYAQSLDIPHLIVTEKTEKYQAMKAATVALAASGTVALELAIAQLPMVITYRLNWLSAFIGKMLLKTQYVSLPNILMGDQIHPELLQEKFTAENVVNELKALLLNEQNAYQNQVDALGNIKKMLIVPGDTPSGHAATVVLKCIGGYLNSKNLTYR